jgi:cold shock CspA family protein
MRLQGKIESWNDERGFGFVVQNSTGEKAFVHISAITDRRRPAIGALVTYEVVSDKRGPKAVDVQYAGQPRTSKPQHAKPRYSRPPRRVSSLSRAMGAVVLVVAAAALINRFSGRSDQAHATPQNFMAEEVERPETSQFLCQPKKTYCSEMTSCAEAHFHQEKCGGTKMDGDGDGIPCESQWCP